MGEKAKPFTKGVNAHDRPIQVKGGKASAAARLQKKTMREWAQAFRDVATKDGKMSLGAAVIRKMYDNGLKGDVRAVEFLAKLQGEMVERIEAKEVPHLVDDL